MTICRISIRLRFRISCFLCVSIQSRGLSGIFLKNMLCMGAGVCGASVGIQSRYYDKLALFYTTCRYEELRKMLQSHPIEKSPRDEPKQKPVKEFEKANKMNPIIIP